MSSSITAKTIDLPGGGFGAISRKERLKIASNQKLTKEAEKEIAESSAYLADVQKPYIMRCGDGRGRARTNGGCQLFGGTAGLVKSLVLAGNVAERNSAAQAIQYAVMNREHRGVPSGGHRADTHGDSTKSGCGECDGAQLAMTNYIKHESKLKGLVEALWLELGYQDRFGSMNNWYGSVVKRLKILTKQQYFVDGAAQIGALEDGTSNNVIIEALPGAHKEVAWVINMIPQKKFAQSRFLKKYNQTSEDSEGIQVFWEDQWAAEREFGDYTTTIDLPKVLLSDILRRVATAANLTKADLKLIVLHSAI